MRVEVIDFPSDVNSELGNLRESLVNALNQAERSGSGAVILEATLRFATGKLKEIYSEQNGEESKQSERHQAADKGKLQRKLDKKLKKQMADAKKKLIKEKNPQLLRNLHANKPTTKDKVSTSKRKAKK